MLQQIRADTPAPSLDKSMKAENELEKDFELQAAILASLHQSHVPLIIYFPPLMEGGNGIEVTFFSRDED